MTHRPSYTRIAVATALAAVAATAANVVLRALAVALLDIPSSFEELAPRAVILSTVAAVIAAGLVFALVARTARNPVRTYVVIATVALIASLWAPLGLDADADAKATLVAMHVVAAAITVPALTRAAGSARPQPR